jgi:hypothetical protein
MSAADEAWERDVVAQFEQACALDSTGHSDRAFSVSVARYATALLQ